RRWSMHGTRWWRSSSARRVSSSSADSRARSALSVVFICLFPHNLIPKVRDLAHIRQPDIRRVHPALCIFLLPADRRGDLSRELSPDALSAQEAEVRDRPDSGEIVLIGAECSGILFHIRRDHLRRLRGLLLKQSA